MKTRKIVGILFLIAGAIEFFYILYLKCSFMSFDVSPYGVCGESSKSFIAIGVVLILLGIYVFFSKPMYESIGFEQELNSDLEVLKKGYKDFNIQIINYAFKNEIVLIIWVNENKKIEDLKKIFLNYNPIINVDNNVIEYHFQNLKISEKILVEIDNELSMV